MTTEVVVAMLASSGTMIAWILYIILDLVMDEEEPSYFRAAAILVSIAYFVILIGSLLYMEYVAAKQTLSRLSCSFWLLFGVTFLVLVGVGGALIYYTEYGIVGIVWIAVCIYILLNLLIYKYRKIIAVAFSLMFIVAGVFILMTSDDNDQSFSGICVLYFGMLILSFGSFLQVYAKNKLKKRRSIFMNAPEVFPMLEYNLDTRQMKTVNGEPMLFFFFVYVVLMWAFSTTIIAEKQWRYIPLSIIGLMLAFAYIYAIEKNVDATTIDRKFFKQATQLFYTSCLVSATDQKKRWRNKDRDIKDVANDPDHEQREKAEYENRNAFINELTTLEDWSYLIATYKKDLGFVGFFESLSKKLPNVKK